MTLVVLRVVAEGRAARGSRTIAWAVEIPAKGPNATKRYEQRWKVNENDLHAEERRQPPQHSGANAWSR